MTDIFIQDVPDEIVAMIDARAKRLGLTRSAYLRRILECECVDSHATLTLEGLERFAARAADLGDCGVVSESWS